MKISIDSHGRYSVKIAKKHLPTVEVMAQNLLNILSQATANDLQSKNWYLEANSFARSVAHEYNVGILSVAQVISALSPQQTWEKNKENTKLAISSYCATGVVPSHVNIYSANARKAGNILQNVPVSFGLKTEAFYKNIMLEESEVTIDTIALRSALGMEKISGAFTPNEAAYRIVADAYRFASEQTEYTPAQLQAIVWTVARRLSSESKITLPMINSYMSIGHTFESAYKILAT